VTTSRPAAGPERAGRRDRRPQRDSSASDPTDDTSGLPDADADPYVLAELICLRLLTARPHSRAELAAAAARRGVPDEIAERLLSRLTELGYVDDAAFATAWVESRHAGRGLARRALAHELRSRGVDEPTLREAVETVDADAELARARELVARRLAGTRGLPVEARVRRLAGLLARKGYSSGLAVRVVREALATEVPEDLIASLDPDD
jgi:regulatory protein